MLEVTVIGQWQLTPKCCLNRRIRVVSVLAVRVHYWSFV